MFLTYRITGHANEPCKHTILHTCSNEPTILVDTTTVEQAYLADLADLADLAERA